MKKSWKVTTIKIKILIILWGKEGVVPGKRKTKSFWGRVVSAMFCSLAWVAVRVVMGLLFYKMAKLYISILDTCVIISNKIDLQIFKNSIEWITGRESPKRKKKQRYKWTFHRKANPDGQKHRKVHSNSWVTRKIEIKYQ